MAEDAVENPASKLLAFAPARFRLAASAINDDNNFPAGGVFAGELPALMTLGPSGRLIAVAEKHDLLLFFALCASSLLSAFSARHRNSAESD